MAKKRNRSNPILIKEARCSLNQLRFEVAEELGVQNAADWENIDVAKRVEVGREMTKKLVAKGMELMMERYGQGQ